MRHRKISQIGAITTCAIFAILLVSTFSCSNEEESYFIEGTINGQTYRCSAYVLAGAGGGATAILASDSESDYLNGNNAWTISVFGTTTGTYNGLTNMILYGVDTANFYIGSGSILSITITSYGDVVEGTFDGQITYSGDAQDYPISGSFRAPMQ